MNEIKKLFERALPEAMPQLAALGYNELHSRVEKYPTLGEINIIELISKSIDRKIEISIHSNADSPNGYVFFSIRRIPKAEKGAIYNSQSISAKVKKYFSSINEANYILNYLKEVEVELLQKYGEIIKGTVFKPDRDDFRNM